MTWQKYFTCLFYICMSIIFLTVWKLPCSNNIILFYQIHKLTLWGVKGFAQVKPVHGSTGTLTYLWILSEEEKKAVLPCFPQSISDLPGEINFPHPGKGFVFLEEKVLHFKKA